MVIRSMTQRPWLRLAAFALIPALVVYVLALALSGAAGIGTVLVIRDLAQTCDTALGIGLISNLGYLLWAAAAAIALFAGFARIHGVRGRERQLLLSGGAFSALLCLDDMFLLHDRYIGSSFLYALYAVFALSILLRFREDVLRLAGPTFLLAVALLGVSIVLDVFQGVLPIGYDSLQLVEEGSKFLGIAIWLAFWCLASARAGKLKVAP